MITNTELTITDELVSCPVDGAEELSLVDVAELADESTARDPGLQTRARRAYERGMVTAEWAIGVVVAVSLAGLLLLFIVKGPAKELVTGIILKIINLVSGWGLKG
jgi:hypothetical protein